jgi:translation initiation factor 2-alpha kinase 4
VLLRSLFTQPTDPAKVFSYDATGAQREHASFVPIVREQAVSIFKMHGAVEDEPPLLMPLMELQEGEKNAAPVFLDRQGDLVMLPKSVVVPLARSAALVGLDRIKRYYCGQYIVSDDQISNIEQFLTQVERTRRRLASRSRPTRQRLILFPPT